MGEFYDSAPDIPTLPSRVTAASPRRSGTRRARGQGGARPAQGYRRSGVRLHQRPGRDRFPRLGRRRSGATARSRRTPPPRKTSLRPAPAVPEGQNWAWSRARSRCCRGTGNGWRSNPAALPSRCADWSTRRGARQGQGPRPAGSGSGVSFHLGDGREPAAFRGSDPRTVRAGPGAAFRPRSRPGRRTCATTPAGSPPRRSNDRQCPPLRLIARK